MQQSLFKFFNVLILHVYTYFVELEVEREKFRRSMDVEMKKLQQTNLETKIAFDEVLNDLFIKFVFI